MWKSEMEYSGQAENIEGGEKKKCFKGLFKRKQNGFE